MPRKVSTRKLRELKMRRSEVKRWFGYSVASAATVVATFFTAVNGGLKQEVFLFYPPKDDSYKTHFTDDGREFWFKLDGKNIYENP